MALFIATRIGLRMVECIVHISNCFSYYPFEKGILWIHCKCTVH